jgi:cytochrome c oxidase assembly protein subunit 11
MAQKNKTNRLIGKLLIVTVAMFAFGVFGMPPLYERFCEITGIGQAGVRVEQDGAAMTTDEDRTVRVRFDATTNSGLPWAFEPVVDTMDVQVGMASEAEFHVENLKEKQIWGRAVYNVTPPEASLYFVKTECFCFTNQRLSAGEKKDMPVRFYIDPDLPDQIREVTLSYTFFLDESHAEIAGVDQEQNSVN